MMKYIFSKEIPLRMLEIAKIKGKTIKQHYKGKQLSITNFIEYSEDKECYILHNCIYKIIRVPNFETKKDQDKIEVYSENDYELKDIQNDYSKARKNIIKIYKELLRLKKDLNIK